jgi:hypothetical protein
MAGAHALPTIRSTLLLFAIVALLRLALLEISPKAAAVDEDRSLCKEHAGRPGWTTVCPSPTVQR